MKLHFHSIAMDLLSISLLRAGIEPGNSMKLTLRGVPADEHAKINDE